RDTARGAAVGVLRAARATIASRGAPHPGARRRSAAGSGLRRHAMGRRAVGILPVTRHALVDTAGADAGAILSGHARVAVVAADHDEHLALGGAAAFPRAGVAPAVFAARRRVTVGVVADAPLPAFAFVVAVDVLARRAGGPALAADADALEGRVRR